jgi:hypothetical protein
LILSASSELQKEDRGRENCDREQPHKRWLAFQRNALSSV